MARSALSLVLVLALVGCGGLSGEEVGFLATDAMAVRALRYGSGEQWVIVVSAPDREAREWEGTARRLAEEGWSVLVVEPRSSSEASQVARDVQGALRYIGDRRPALVGEGVSASAALWAAAGGEVGAVAAFSPIGYPGLEGRMRRIVEPKLLVASVGDRHAVEAQARLVANAPPPLVVRTYPGGRAGLDLLTEDEAALADMLAFLRSALEVP